MLKSSKKNLVLNSSVVLHEHIEAEGKGRKFVSRFIEAGVAHYQEFGDILITKETLDKFVHTMVGCPVIINHKDITEKNADDERVGVVSNVWYNQSDGWYYCEGIIWDKQAIDLVKNHNWNVSCTYDFESDFIEKTHNGKKIDMEFTNGKFLHLALVNNPRYERANIVMNGKDKVENDRWITIHPNGEDSKGRPLLIKDGESPKEAIERTYGKGEKSETKEGKEEKKSTFKPVKGIMQSLKDDYEAGKINAKEVAKELSKANLTPYLLDDNEALEKIGVKQTDSKETKKEKETKEEEKEDKGIERKVTFKDKKYSLKDLVDDGFTPIKYTGSIYKDDHLTWLTKDEGKTNYRLKISQEEYDQLNPIYQEKLNKKFENYNYGKGIKRKSENPKSIIERKKERLEKSKQEKAEQLRYKEAIKAYKKNDKKEENGNIVDVKVGEENIKSQKAKPDFDKMLKEKQEERRKAQDFADYAYEVKRKSLEKIEKLKKEKGIQEASDEAKSKLEFIKERYKENAKYMQNNEKQLVEEVIEKLKTYTVNNGKDIFMTVLNELENFVKGIVENACGKKEEIEEEETIVENEDKRKLIDEIGGILKDKVDEEVWRTIVGKIEKIAYEPSEETKADNKCKNEDEEKEEKFEEEKEIAENKKAKNEEKVEEIKKEEKEEKVENSMDKAREIAMGGNTEYKNTSYSSQKERLELGNNY